MFKKLWLITFLLFVFQAHTKENKIHPIATSEGGLILTVNQQNITKWNPLNPDLDVIHAAAIHIAAQQCSDGGFGWPHNDCSATYHNITAPIMNGIHKAWVQTGNSAYLGLMINGGNFDLLSEYSNGESRFGTFTSGFMWNLSLATSDFTYKDFVENNLFAELEAGTYGPNDLDTAGWIASVVTNRQGTWINLLPWEFKSLAKIARNHGRMAQADLFELAILDNFNTMDDTSPSTVYSDLIGVAGGILGLAQLNRQTFPAINSPKHHINGMTSLQQLVDFLISKQNPDGSWYWHSDMVSPMPTEDDKDTQTTAYAVLALIKANQILPADYLPAINAGQNWLESIQGQFGGFPSYPGGDENTEVEAEALSALATTVVEFSDAMFSDSFEN